MSIRTGQPGVRALLFRVLLLALVPLLLAVGAGVVGAYRARRAEELAARLEMARAAAAAFERSVLDLVREERLLASVLPAEPEAGSARLRAVAQGHPPVRAFYLVDRSGRVVASSDPRLIGADLGQGPLFAALLREGGWRLSGLALPPAGGAPVFHVASAVSGPDGAPAVLGAMVDSAGLADTSLPPPRSAEGEVALFDSCGTLVLRAPRPPPSWQQRQGALARVSAAMQPLDGGRAGRFVLEPGEEARLGALAPVGALGWTAAASRPARTALRDHRLAAWGQGGLALIVAALSLAGALAVARRLLRGLEGVLRQTRALAAREPLPRFASGIREIDELAGSLQAVGTELKESEGRLRRFLENASDYAYRYRLRPSRGFELVSSSSARVVGRSPEEHYADPDLPLHIVHPEDRPRVERLLRDEVDLDGPLLLRVVRPDGGVRWLEHRVVPLRDEAGRLLAVEGIARDMTERIDAEERERAATLRAQQEAANLQAVFEAVADGLVLYDREGRIARINSAARALFALHEAAHAESFGERARRFEVHDEEGAPVPPERLPMVRAQAERRPVRQVILRFRAKGAAPTRWVSVSAAPLFRGEQLDGAIASFTDVTRVREMQQRYQDLARIVSHDLRTPLATVSMQAQMLERRAEEPGEVRRRAASIHSSVRRMDTLIRDLVDVARVESGQLQLQRQSLDLAAFVQDLVERLAGPLDTRRVQLDVEPGLPRPLADPDRLERVLVNLLSNALKYSPPEHEVRLRVRRNGSTSVELSVSDRGMGIAPEEVPKLFSRFYRTQRARRAEGLGLGLFITAMLVRAHGGRIEVESALGRGSTFRVILPAGPEPAGDAEGASP